MKEVIKTKLEEQKRIKEEILKKSKELEAELQICNINLHRLDGSIISLEEILKSKDNIKE